FSSLTYAAIWSDTLGIKQVGIHDNFFELGGHSLLALKLVAQVEHKFGKTIPLAALFEYPTIEALAAHLREEGQPSDAFPLVALQEDGTRAPLFFIHPHGGTLFCYNPLVQALGTEQPVYGLQAAGINGETAPLESIEKIAGHYLTAIRTVQPQGPYQLAGWSSGGIIAFEMARQLHAQDETIALLALIDSYSPQIIQAVETFDDTRLMSLFLQDIANTQDVSFVHWEVSPSAGQSQAVALLEKAKTAGLLAGYTDTKIEALWHVFKANTRAVAHYQPQPYPGSTLLITAHESGQASVAANGWNKLAAGPLQVHNIPTDHYRVMRSPHIESVAKFLSAYLQVEDFHATPATLRV
ncbi:MAG: non-ribosomal peptide synthetase, partial [Candidatus Electrothrix sp. EH2]|nr:non-ribosomal peptide synthetase [Candidatus Electrothrix sp. EH2]